MTQVICFVIGLLLGVGLYRLAFQEGRIGQVIPLVRKKAKKPNKAIQKVDRLLQNIDRYDGTANGQQPL